jgi:hypothetical protein
MPTYFDQLIYLTLHNGKYNKMYILGIKKTGNKYYFKTNSEHEILAGLGRYAV